jgi:hypothetical protein
MAGGCGVGRGEVVTTRGEPHGGPSGRPTHPNLVSRPPVSPVRPLPEEIAPSWTPCTYQWGRAARGLALASSNAQGLETLRRSNLDPRA